MSGCSNECETGVLDLLVVREKDEVLRFVSFFFLESKYLTKCKQRMDGAVSCYGPKREEEYAGFGVPCTYRLKDSADAASLAESAERLKNLMKSDTIPRYIELVLCLEALEHEK